MQRAAVVLATGLAVVGLGLTWLGRPGDLPVEPALEPLGAQRQALELSHERAVLEAPRAAVEPIEAPVDRELTPVQRADPGALTEHHLARHAALLTDARQTRETIDLQGLQRAADLAPLGADGRALLWAALDEPERSGTERLAAADLLVQLAATERLAPAARELLWSRTGAAPDTGPDGPSPRPGASVAERALWCLGTGQDRAELLDAYELRLVPVPAATPGTDRALASSDPALERTASDTGPEPPSPAALAWVLAAGPDDGALAELAARAQGPLAAGSLAALARRCEPTGTGPASPLDGHARLAWRDRLELLGASPPPGCEERLRAAVDAFARLTADATLTMPGPRDEGTVRRLVARIERRDPSLWQAARVELQLLAADPELDGELRRIVERGLAP